MAIKLFIQVEDKENNGYKPIEVDAVILKEPIGGRSHFVHASTSFGENWIISEYESGAKAGWGWSVENALERAKTNINGVGQEKYVSMIEERVNKYGKANTAVVPAQSDMTAKEIEKELEALMPEEVEEDDDDEY